MRGNIEFVGYSILAPACLALLAAWLCRKVLPADSGRRYSVAVGAAVGFAAGYVLLPDWAPLVPERHWQWLAYLGLGAAIVAGASLATGVLVWERWLVYAAFAFVCAWQLVPTWDTLQPPRVLWIPLLAAYLTLLFALLSALPERLLGKSFAGTLVITCLAVAIFVLIEVSAKFGMVGGTLAAALAGCTASFQFTKQDASHSTSSLATECRGLIAIYAVLVEGLAFVGTIEPVQPVFALMMLPAAPLVLWLFAFGPLARLKGLTAATIQGVAVGIILMIVAAWILFGRSADEWPG